MKKFVFGILLCLLELILLIGGIVCLIIGLVLNQREASTLVETLLILGISGTGAGVGGIITFTGALLIVEGIN